MRKLRIHDAATLEASEAAAWYERVRTGLGAEFEQAIDRALDVLEQDIGPADIDAWSRRKAWCKEAVSQAIPVCCDRAGVPH